MGIELRFKVSLDKVKLEERGFRKGLAPSFHRDFKYNDRIKWIKSRKGDLLGKPRTHRDFKYNDRIKWIKSRKGDLLGKPRTHRDFK